MIGGLFRDAHALGVRRRQVLLILAFQLGSVGMELAGIFSLLPIIQFILAKGDIAALVAQHRHWAIMADVYGAVGLPLSLAGLLSVSFLFILTRQLFVFARLRYEAWLREGTIARVRFEIFEHFLHARLDRQEGDAAGAVVNDLTTELQRAVGYLFARITVAGFFVTLAIYAAGLLILSPLMTLIALVLFALAGILLRGQMRKSGETGKIVTEANSKMSGYLVERLKQARLIRLAGLEAAEAEEMRQLTERQRWSMTRLFWLLANVEVMVEPIVVAAGFVFLYVSVGILDYPVEGVGLFLIVLLRLLPVVKQLARTRQTVVGFAPSFGAVIGRADALRRDREPPGGDALLSGAAPEIRFDRVTFHYAPLKDGGAPAPALNGLAATLPAGRMTAIVGPSGAGKSTLFDLLPRLRDPQQGAILIDGRDIGDFSLKALRASIAYVPQSPQIFNISAAQHIRLGKPSATDEEVAQAARLAHAHDFISALPDGYATLLGEGGGRLSGGQRQRLDLARALVGGAPILLLDEPTASLDAESEAAFQDALDNLRHKGDTTIVVIAHRLTTVAKADQIIVLRDGAVEAAGRHDELMRAGGWYADAFHRQTGATARASEKNGVPGNR